MPIDKDQLITDRCSIGISGWKLMLILLFLMSATLAACGGSGSKKTEQVLPLVACDLFTAEELATYLGDTVDEPIKTHVVDEETNSWMSICNWYSAEANSGIGLHIRNHNDPGNPVVAFEEYQADILEQAPDWKTVYIDGLGDAAVWETSMKDLTWFSGPYVLTTIIVSPNMSDDAALELALGVSHETQARIK